jgi:predicted small lipoprotein YifL
MKRKHITRILAILLAAALLAACGASAPTAEPPQDQPAPAVEEEQAPAAETAAGPCDNIFYPMTVDNQWVYDYGMEDTNGTMEESSMALTVSQSEGSSAVLAALSYDTGIVTESAVQCSDQAILNFPMTELKMVLGDLAGSIDLQYQSGTFMPSEQEFAANNWSMEWETDYVASGSLQASYEGEELSAVLDASPVKMKWKVAATGESLQVPAGDFSDLVKMERQISFDVSNLQTNIQGNDVNISTTLTVDTELWYAPHIGLVKQDVNGISIKLYGISFPVEAYGYIQLSSYTIN